MQEAKSFLVSNPNCASAPQLHNKMDEANNKYTKVEQLLQCSQEKYGASTLQSTFQALTCCHKRLFELETTAHTFAFF